MMSMRTHHQYGRARIAVATALALLAQPLTPLMGQTPTPQTAAQKPATVPLPSTTAGQASPLAAAAAKPATKPAVAQAPPVDGGWPRAYQTPAGTRVVVYQPQVAEWAAQKHMVAYAAVGVESPGAQKPALGSIKVEADTRVALDSRLVSFSDMAVTESNFPSLSKDQTREIVAEVVKSIPTEDRVIALDRVLAAVDKSQILPKNVEGVKADPPPICFSQTPAVLVNIDGDPIWSPIKENDLKYAVNTNWDLFQHEPTKTFYLMNNGSWLTTTDLKGTWSPVGKLPESFSKLPADENWKETKSAVPGKKLAANKVPKVFVSFAPAEMILLTGAPSYVLVDGTQNLLWVSNTESDVFRMGKTGPVYFLVSGRWFSAPDFTGPWTFATPQMPEVFETIPLEHPALAGAGRRARHAAGGRGRAPRPGAADGSGQQEDHEGAGGDIPGRAEVPAHREDEARVRGEHGQADHQVRRPLLHVFPGRLVHVEERDRAVGGRLVDSQGDLRNSDQFPGAQRHVRHG